MLDPLQTHLECIESQKDSGINKKTIKILRTLSTQEYK